ncbi:hypothetical protein BDR04DRAFT_1120596 [Suillus decipiens]|nr:hypothetical protein BDR04DRAFT_1120596 [Suillus decipiens]
MVICNAFSLSCQSYLHLDDIYVGGFVLYMGTVEVDIVNKKQADIKELVDYLTTVIKYNYIENTAALPSFTHSVTHKFNLELLCKKGEGTCDHNCCVTPIMMLEKFAIEGVGIPYEAKNIPWMTMLNLLYPHQAQIIDWPAGVSCGL